MSTTLGSYVAANANDGNHDDVYMTGGSCVSSDHGDTNPYWAVDLTVPLHVHHIIFTNRGDGAFTCTYLAYSALVEYVM